MIDNHVVPFFHFPQKTAVPMIERTIKFTRLFRRDNIIRPVMIIIVVLPVPDVFLFPMDFFFFFKQFCRRFPEIRKEYRHRFSRFRFFLLLQPHFTHYRIYAKIVVRNHNNFKRIFMYNIYLYQFIYIPCIKVKILCYALL